MTSRKEMQMINKMVEIIKKEGRISKVSLVMLSGISISYYEKLKPFVEELYPHKVQYDKNDRIWKSIKNEELVGIN